VTSLGFLSLYSLWILRDDSLSVFPGNRYCEDYLSYCFVGVIDLHLRLMSTPIYFSLIVCECGNPAGIIPRAGTGTVRKCSPRHLTGARAGRFLPAGARMGDHPPTGNSPLPSLSETTYPTGHDIPLRWNFVKITTLINCLYNFGCKSCLSSNHYSTRT
jgi:hypothetical protein